MGFDMFFVQRMSRRHCFTVGLKFVFDLVRDVLRAVCVSSKGVDDFPPVPNRRAVVGIVRVSFRLVQDLYVFCFVVSP